MRGKIKATKHLIIKLCDFYDFIETEDSKKPRTAKRLCSTANTRYVFGNIYWALQRKFSIERDDGEILQLTKFVYENVEMQYICISVWFN